MSQESDAAAAAFVSWDSHKENIQPISQGRKIDALMEALPLVNNYKLRQKLFEERKEQFDKAIQENADDASRQLDLWHEYIDWLEQNVPDGGKVNGITNAIEQCIELYYDKKEFKQDKRLFDIFMKFKRFCDEPVEIFGFMYANSICVLLARFYLNWSWQYEIRKNMKRAEDLIKLGLKNLASPRDVLLEAEAQLKCRLERMVRSGELDACPEQATLSGPMNTREAQQRLANDGIRAALQTLKFRINKKKGESRVAVNRINTAVDRANVGGLKSQITIVNGIRVPKKTKPRTTSTTSINKPIQIFTESATNGENNNDDENTENNNSSSNNNNNSGLAGIMIKVPTSQRIRTVGRSGPENRVAPVRSFGAILER